MSESYELKPNKTAFVTYPVMIGFIFSSIILATAYFVANIFVEVSFVFLIIAIVAFNFLIFYWRSVRYGKEKYIFTSNRIIHKSGTIFSDSETELIVRNITHVTMRLPFIENKLFSTGHVNIQSAGSGAAAPVFAGRDQTWEGCWRRVSTIRFSCRCSAELLWGLPARWPSSEWITCSSAPGIESASAVRSSRGK